MVDTFMVLISKKGSTMNWTMFENKAEQLQKVIFNICGGSRVDKNSSYQHDFRHKCWKLLFEVVRLRFETFSIHDRTSFRYKHHKRVNHSLNFVYEMLQTSQFHTAFVVCCDVFTWFVFKPTCEQKGNYIAWVTR